MKIVRMLVSAVLCAVAMCFVQFTSAAEVPSDAQSLQQLAKSGSDLSKLHHVEFHLRFPTEDEAARAVARLEDLAFATKTQRDEARDSWVVLASKTMYPVEPDLKGLSRKLKGIAADEHGSYEGWRAHQQN